MIVCVCVCVCVFYLSGTWHQLTRVDPDKRPLNRCCLIHYKVQSYRVCLQLNEKCTHETDNIVTGVDRPDELFVVSTKAVQCTQDGSDAVLKHVLH